MKFKLSSLALLVATTALPLAASASGLSRTSQSTGIFFEKGRLFEAGGRMIKPELPGKYTPNAAKLGGAFGNADSTPNSDAPNAYKSLGFGLKADINDKLRFALIYDQPWGVNYGYTRGYYNGWNADVDTHNLTFLLGGQVAPGFTLFAGPALENNNADINVVLRAPTANPAKFNQTSYHANFSDTNWGYVFGGAYEIPEIALRVALTYRSEVKHKQDANEAIDALEFDYSSGKPPKVTAKPQIATSQAFSYKSPKSINLDFQTGVTQSTLLMASIRWTDHANFVINPATWSNMMKASGAGYKPLASYDKASFEYSLGVGQKINDMFTVAAGIAGDGGTGGDSNDGSPFGPTKSTFTYTLGTVVKASEQLSFTLGMGYTQIKGGGTLLKPNMPAAKFEDGNAIAYAGKVSIRF